VSGVRPRNGVPARAETARQAIGEALRAELLTAHELSHVAGVPEREVVGHLEHLERSLRARGEHLVVEPARCEACGFAFKKRDRLARPSRCPVCKEDRIVGPRFTLGK
jgi:predicted Zn-ribbon and HTH transcriptional regulator